MDETVRQKSHKDYLFLILSLIPILLFYLWFQTAAQDRPLFLLRPVSWISGMLSGVHFDFESGTGFCGITEHGRVIVGRSCSGGNFLVICYGLLVITQTNGKIRWRRFGSAACLLALSYLLAVVASALRIAATILLMDLRLGLDLVVMHNVIGIITYFTLICLCFFGLQWLKSRSQAQGMVP